MDITRTCEVRVCVGSWATLQGDLRQEKMLGLSGDAECARTDYPRRTWRTGYVQVSTWVVMYSESRIRESSCIALLV
jgi:hypothetical protein